MRNSKLSKQIAIVTVEGTRKKGKPRKRWRNNFEEDLGYDMIHLLTAIGLTPGGSSTVYIYIQTIHRTTQLTILVGRLSGIRTQNGQTKINDKLTA
jgi:hypothetical protein